MSRFPQPWFAQADRVSLGHAFDTVNALIREGAAAVTTSPSEAKRAYLMALNNAKKISARTADSAVRKYRALTLAAVGLGLCTQARERFLQKAREYNTQAMLAAQRTTSTDRDKVRLDEADLQVKEARMLEKQQKKKTDAMMKQFMAFCAYQAVVADLDAPRACENAPDHNNHATALIGCGKMAVSLQAQQGGSFNVHGQRGEGLMAPHAYFQRALNACQRGRMVQGITPDDIVLLRDTEGYVQRLLHTNR